eukprot:COSAG01_NODE_36901_length_511_cov_0.905340_1_plen_86_part_10
MAAAHAARGCAARGCARPQRLIVLVTRDRLDAVVRHAGASRALEALDLVDRAAPARLHLQFVATQVRLEVLRKKTVRKMMCIIINT